MPVPVQAPADSIVLPEQTPGRQRTPAGYMRQPPLPSQVPSKLQVSASPLAQVMSSWPAGVGLHMPSLPGTAQLWQTPPHAVLQQTPSTQLRLLHSSAATQAAPIGSVNGAPSPRPSSGAPSRPTRSAARSPERSGLPSSPCGPLSVGAGPSSLASGVTPPSPNAPSWT